MVTSVDYFYFGKGNKSSNKGKALSQFLTRMKRDNNLDFKISFDSVPNSMSELGRVHLILFFTQSCM